MFYKHLYEYSAGMVNLIVLFTFLEMQSALTFVL